jgi:hypothetical protein
VPISRVAEGLVPWRAGTLEFLEGWYPGGLVPWSSWRAGALVGWYPGGWYPGVPGGLVPWRAGTLEGWYPGGLVPWRAGILEFLGSRSVPISKRIRGAGTLEAGGPRELVGADL